MNAKKKEEEFEFEGAIQRLEEILERMNSGDSTLDESLALFQEADGLIVRCSKRLADAERKIETLVKDRSGKIELSSSGEPLTEEFSK